MKKFLLSLLLLSACAEGGHFTVHEENDYFNPFAKNQDKYYTQGAKFTYQSVPEADWTTDSYSVGNSIYTPHHKHVKELIPDERPYAGYSYGEFSRKEYPSSNVENRTSVQAGLIGPGSGGKFFQSGVHQLLGQTAPDGWSNQLKDEPTLNALWEQRRKTDLRGASFFHYDGILNYGADLGNVSTLVRLGGIVRFGYFDRTDFGPSLIFPRIPRVERKKFELYFFTGGEGRDVIRNIFLDGNTFENSASVTKRPFVADGKFGFAVGYGEMKLTYTYVAITDEWKEKASSQSFGSVDITWGF